MELDCNRNEAAVCAMSSRQDGLPPSPRHSRHTQLWLHWHIMRFDLITIFPEFFVGPLDHGILRRARETGLVNVNIQDLREFTKDRHRTVDDRPFGGGEG